MFLLFFLLFFCFQSLNIKQFYQIALTVGFYVRCGFYSWQLIPWAILNHVIIFLLNNYSYFCYFVFFFLKHVHKVRVQKQQTWHVGDRGAVCLPLLLPIECIPFISQENVNELHTALQNPLYCSVAVTPQTMTSNRTDSLLYCQP